jgi:deoxycytidylate deaminase
MRTAGVQYISLHAEINALFKTMKSKNRSFRMGGRKSSAKDNCNGTTIYVVRLMLKREGMPSTQRHWYGNAKPCDRCQKFLYKYGVKKIKYTDVRIVNGKEVNVLCEMKRN